MESTVEVVEVLDLLGISGTMLCFRIVLSVGTELEEDECTFVVFTGWVWVSLAGVLGTFGLTLLEGGSLGFGLGFLGVM